MSESCTAALASSLEKRGNSLPAGAIFCTPNLYVIVARARWPEKTAENWAAAAGREPRIAKDWLNGKVSDAGKLAIVRLLV